MQDNIKKNGSNGSKRRRKNVVVEINRFLQDLEAAKKESIIYFSNILNQPVFDNKGLKIGKIKDIAINTNSDFPNAIAVVYKGKDKKIVTISWDYVKKYGSNGIILKSNESKIPKLKKREGVFLDEDILDMQLVDTNGIKLIRANDIALTKIGENLCVVSIDIGIKGLLRRLGLNAFLTHIRDNLIPWRYVGSLSQELKGVKLNLAGSQLYDLHPADFADLLEELTQKERISIIKKLNNNYLARILEESTDEIRISIIEKLPDKKLANIFAKMHIHKAADAVLLMNKNRIKSLLKQMEPEIASHLKKIISYPKESAGRIMSRKFVTVYWNLTVGEIISYLRNMENKPPILHNIYVTKENKVLIGAITLNTLLYTPPRTPINSMIKKRIISIHVKTRKEEASSIMAKYDLTTLPIINKAHQIIGVVNIEDLIKESIPITITPEQTNQIEEKTKYFSRYLNVIKEIGQILKETEELIIIRKHFGKLKAGSSSLKRKIMQPYKKEILLNQNLK